MKAVAYQQSLPISNPHALSDVELPKPEATGRDLLVKIKAIAVNPVDYKIRQNVSPSTDEHKILGWDAVGEVIAVGEHSELFKAGDEVYYAGDLQRPGSNAECQLVDERLVGRKPVSLSAVEAAALPLTSITAWELLFEHLALQQQTPGATTPTDDVLLVIGAAGGVGSILLQLAKTLTGVTVIATASRPDSQQWVRQLGADHVIDHSQPLEPQIAALGCGQVSHVASLNSTASYFDTYVKVLAPFGKIALIDDPKTLDVSKIKLKSLSLHWEFMFARSMFQAADMGAQGQLLNQVAALTDAGHIKTTVGKHLGLINATNLKKAHELLESGQAIGKVVLEGFA